MAATTLKSESQRAGTTPIAQSVTVTNGQMGVSVSIQANYGGRSNEVRSIGLTFTADEAEAFAAALIAKANNVRLGIHDNDFGAS